MTGATGYIGGRLVPRLLERGHAVRVLVRDAKRIRGRPWADMVEVSVGDLTDPKSVDGVFEDIDCAYYLVHSIYTGPRFAERDRLAATNFVRAAKGLEHVIYLGGLMPGSGEVSEHLRSRAEVGRLLRERLPTTEFRAGPIIGSGSASFEMVRYITERLPAMIVPRVFLNEVQPVAVRDVLNYLGLAVEVGPAGIVEIGGGDRVTFKGMIETYARARQLRRWVFPVPIPFLPRAAAWWVSLVAPLNYDLARALLTGLSRPLHADTARARALYPEVTPITYGHAVRLAVERIDAGRVETHWSGALGGGPTYTMIDWEGVVKEVRTIHVAAAPGSVFDEFCGLGGDRGWLVWAWAWWMRGLLDKLAGGPGLRRGRRHPTKLLPGEALDFWRVEAIESSRLLCLRAEMKLPGRAWLQWEAVPEADGTRLVQTAAFSPIGLSGAIYWYGLYPLHSRIFSDLVRAIGRAAEESRSLPDSAAQ